VGNGTLPLPARHPAPTLAHGQGAQCRAYGAAPVSPLAHPTVHRDGLEMPPQLHWPQFAAAESSGAMVQETEQARPGLEAIAGAAKEAVRRGPPPVHMWNPPFCGDLDMRIASDGTWFYLKTPIGRPALVKLFASVLKREGDSYFLVTPVEKCGIVVEDAPFLAVELKLERDDRGRTLHFRTNVDDWIVCGIDHALRFEREIETGGLKPYLHVRRNLWAKVTRALFYDLVELGEERDIGGKRMFGVMSAGEFFAMAAAESLKDLV
jgi:uncharacterized protein